MPDNPEYHEGETTLAEIASLLRQVANDLDKGDDCTTRFIALAVVATEGTFVGPGAMLRVGRVNGGVEPEEALEAVHDLVNSTKLLMVKPIGRRSH